MIALVAAGGSGSRMAPATNYVNKHLIPIGNNELMIDMPLHFLAWHNIRYIEIITGNNHASQICDYVGDGEKYGFRRVEYGFQTKPLGIADVLKRVSHKRGQASGVAMILADNYFSRPQPKLMALEVGDESSLAHCWSYNIGSLEKAKSFGQITRGIDDLPISVIEKPQSPIHTHILTGLYYFPVDVFDRVTDLSPSKRGELEVTDLLRMYLDDKKLRVHAVIGEWCDLGEQNSWAEFVANRSKK